MGLIFVLEKNNFFFHFNRTEEPDQSILITCVQPYFFFLKHEVSLDQVKDHRKNLNIYV